MPDREEDLTIVSVATIRVIEIPKDSLFQNFHRLFRKFR